MPLIDRFRGQRGQPQPATVPCPTCQVSNYGREGATAFTAKGRQFGVTVDRDSDSMLSRSTFA